MLNLAKIYLKIHNFNEYLKNICIVMKNLAFHKKVVLEANNSSFLKTRQSTACTESNPPACSGGPTCN